TARRCDMSQPDKRKRRGQLPEVARKKVLLLVAGLLVGSAALSEVIKPGHEQYLIAASAGEMDYRTVTEAKALEGSTFQSLAPTLLGVREVMASLMWVQADDYFHRGEYRPI